MTAALDKWNPAAGGSARWRDREVVESIWKVIEDNMRDRGWTKDHGPTAT